MDGRWLVQEDISLIPSKRTGPLSSEEQRTIQSQVVERLREQDPMLYHIMEVKVVRNPRKNFINLIVRKDYITMIFYKTFPDVDDTVTYCFFLPDKLEPYVIITAVHHRLGKLRNITTKQLDELKQVISLLNYFMVHL